MSRNDAAPALEIVGDNPTRLWGLTAAERAGRIARAQSLETGDYAEPPLILANAAHVFHQLWLREIARRPGAVLTLDGVPALAHVRSQAERDAVAAAMRDARPIAGGSGLEQVPFETSGTIVDAALRKRESPFLARLTPDSVRGLERTSYYAAYKGVTDVLTKYLWPEWALALTRLCARLGVTPNMVTALGALLCVIATVAFWNGAYWTGMATGLGFMVLDTVDGKLARCTITSSWWGNIFDHGIDLIHPPFWWWAWAVGLGAVGLALSDTAFAWTMAVIVGGYVVQRLIEGVFMRRFGMHIHVWRKIDSDFRLITARRNPNMVILLVSLIAGRPDLGLIAVAAWTALSCLFHLVRLGQAFAEQARGRAILSWLG